eukprot:c1191_g1_i1.p1 GENE.c1191_g1_i1~~c1191_g1_i1.p1  ORF type:complete len:225 (-),score=38.39 c1191_g1_i1:162-836(-)
MLVSSRIACRVAVAANRAAAQSLRAAPIAGGSLLRGAASSRRGYADEPSADSHPPPGQDQDAPPVDPVKALEAKVADLNDKYLRALAEMENVRMRARKDVESARSFGIQSFAKSLFDVSDNLDRAVAAATPAEHGPFYEGVVMTQKQMQRSFADNGLEILNPIGEVFSAELHQALFEVPDADKTPGTVAVVTRTGFRLNGRILRPAQVGVVAKAPAAAAAPAAE